MPVSDGHIKRPRWSVMIPVYNCAAYLVEAIESVLMQCCDDDWMQIEVVDDCSTDADIEAIVLERGQGRVSYYRQHENVGSLRNFQTCLERSSGELIHILHGDDRVRPGFYASLDALFLAHPQIGASFCRYTYIDESGRALFHQDEEAVSEGVLEGWLERLCEKQRIQYCSIAVRRCVYERLGGFYGVEYGEDWEMWVRIAANYPVAYTPHLLAEYRKHYATISGRTFADGKNMICLRWVMERIQQYLPAGRRSVVMQTSRRFYAHYALRVANTLWTRFNNRRGALTQALAAWNMSRDVGLLFKIVKLYTRIVLNI